MSVHVLSWVLRNSPAKLGARLVLLVLADHAREDGTMAWPSVETIADESRMSRRAVQDCLKKLREDGGIIERGKSRSGTTIYDVVMGGADSAPGRSPEPAGAQNPSQGGAAAAPEPSKGNDQGSGTPIAHEPTDFEAWLQFHHEITGSAVPREGTDRRMKLAATFAGLVQTGATLEDFQLETEGVFASPHMREGGHLEPENVLRKTRFGSYADKGRRAREARETGVEGKYGHLDG